MLQVSHYFLPACKHKKKKPCQCKTSSVGLPGLEPGKAGPESAVLPLHHSPMLKCDAKIQQFSLKKTFSPFFYLKISKKKYPIVVFRVKQAIFA